jgi:hypothetical protein
MDEGQLDKLHYFLYCLKSNGIYANLNMHVTRNYPEIFYDKEILKYFSYGKGIDRYYPSLIREQLKYAEALLGSYNNYTGYKLGDDPMILYIELNNENSIYDLENDNKINGMNDNLKTELIKQWRNFIKNKYKSYEEIDKLYNNETIDYSKDLVENNEIYCQKSGSECIINGKSVVFNVTVLPKESWGNQIHYNSINISNFTTYTVEFDAKVGNGTETVTFYFQENKLPYRNYLRIGNIKLTTELQHFILSGKTEYNIQYSENASAVVEIILPSKINIYEVNNLKIYKGKAYTSFTENNEKNLDKILYPNSTLIQNLPNMAYDLRYFFYQTETNTQKNLTNFIKNDLGFNKLYIVDSQVNYGIFFSYVRENENSDLIDIHGYWDHPKFPDGLLWKRDYYYIQNSPMIKSSTFGTFDGLSKGKIYGKPYSISEYNHPFPNEHSHEKFAMFGSWSAFHDYDAIYQFSYDQARDEDYITRYFKMSSNPVDFAMAPYIALAFRKNYVKKSNNYVKVKLTKGYIMEKMRDRNYNMKQFLQNYLYTGWSAYFEVQIINDDKYIEPVIDTNINLEEKGYFMNEQIQWNNTDVGNEAYYSVTTEKYITLTGFLGNSRMSKENKLGDLINIKVKLNEELNETCTVGLVSLDDQKLENSKKLLLTVVGKVRNTDQKWNNDRTSTYNKDWGKGPILAQFIEIESVLKFKHKPRVYSINRLGEFGKEFDLTGKENNWILKSDEGNPTLNYYITIDHSDNGNGNKVLTIIIIIILLALIIGVVIIFYIMKKRKKSSNTIEEPGEIFLNDRND